ncbi:MAG: hypothetical protein IT580_21105, partial [Verrucomicrobiales bacterium]|nr:hypothetical protein [Verrucomicrobiales bacterium]
MALIASSMGAEPVKTWTPSAAISVKEEYDSNVYLQDIGSLGDRDSMVTTVIPALGVSYANGSAVMVKASYAPEVVFFHAEPTEDHVLHRMALGAGGKVGKAGTEWDVQNALLVIAGEDEGLVYSGPGGAGAAGAPRVRDRRDAAILRSGVKITQPVGRAFVRPVASLYVHDFQARHSAAPGYLNFVDRRDVNGGVDVGTTLAPGFRGQVGYRYGVQDQARLLNFPEEYDNTYHRVLFGLEGSPWKWMKLGVSVGPEFRSYGEDVPAGFGSHDELNLFVDATVTLTLAPGDSVVLSAKQFEQPGFGGRSTYEDLTYDLTWRHKFGEHLAVGASGRAYNTDFSYPTMRDDWVLSVSGTVAWTFNKHIQAEASITY